MFPFTLPDLTLRVHGTGEEGETGDCQQPVLLTETLSPDSHSSIVVFGHCSLSSSNESAGKTTSTHSF